MVEHTRTLDFKVAFAIGLGTMIAAGIFSLSGIAVYQIGSTAVIAFVLAAVVAGITAASYSEFASIYSENGGGYLFTSRTFEDSDLLTYGVGMSLFLGYTGTTAFYLATMDEWFFRFLIPESFHVLPHGTFGVTAALLLGYLNAQGTEESGLFQLIITSAKVVVLLLFIGGMFASVGVGTAMGEFTGSFEIELVNTASIAALAFITFFGFSAIAASAGEIIEPRKTVPRAIAASIGTVTVLYAFVIVAMVNIRNVSGRLARSPDEILQLGETAMGAVAQAFIPVTVAGIPLGKYLIVAGAIFSMVSASNASILAASGIGSLMGRQGQAPRRFARIHREYRTPFWSVATATGIIATLIVVFMTLLSEEGLVGALPVGLSFTLPRVAIGPLAFGGPVAIEEFALGLNALTGFATLNLLLPLAVVNYALIHSRRHIDVERGFRVPGVPLVPVVGIIANVALIYNLPTVGVVIGLTLIAVLVGVYLLWGGGTSTEEITRQVVPPEAATDGETAADDRPVVLVPIARPSRAVQYAELAAALGRTRGEDPLVRLLNIVELPDQTPHEIFEEDADVDASEIRDRLDAADLDFETTVEAHTARDIGFAIVRTARQQAADLVVMGFPEDHLEVAEQVEFDAPCDVVFASNADADDLSVVNVGSGGGPHHIASLSLVRSLGSRGSRINLIRVTPGEGGGTPERLGKTAEELDDVDVDTFNVTSNNVADGLVEKAAENGGVLIIGASRTRRLRRWVLGSTPDRVVRLATERDVPVLVYATQSGVPEWFEDWLFPVYRAVRRIVRGRDRYSDTDEDESKVKG